MWPWPQTAIVSQTVSAALSLAASAPGVTLNALIQELSRNSKSHGSLTLTNALTREDSAKPTIILKLKLQSKKVRFKVSKRNRIRILLLQWYSQIKYSTIDKKLYLPIIFALFRWFLAIWCKILRIYWNLL